MSTRFLLPLLFGLLSAVVAGAEDRSAPSRWADSVVTIDVAATRYNYYLPWSTAAFKAEKMGVVIADRQILTTANQLFNRTLVRIQKGGRGRWWVAHVTWIDYHANLALIAVDEAEFWKGTRPLGLSRTTPNSGKLEVLRWTGGTLQTYAAEFKRYSAGEEQLSKITHVVLEASSEIEGAGTGEPMVAGSRLVGLVRTQVGRTCLVTPVSFIESILEAQRRGTYRGLGFFHFYWQRAVNPDSLDYLALTGKPRGVVVIDVPQRPDGFAQVLQPRDLLLKIDGFDIDTEGDYKDPEFGLVNLENLSTRRRWAGDDVNLQIWREGKLQQVTYRLPRFEHTNSLVALATFDEEPEYMIVGGLVFQPLILPFLGSWGPEWTKKAPFRLGYYLEQPPTKDRRALVMLSQVLPDDYNLGYQDLRTVILARVNGRSVEYMTDLREALQHPLNGFHVLEFSRGESPERLVLAAGSEEEEATQRVLTRYAIPSKFRLKSESTASQN